MGKTINEVQDILAQQLDRLADPKANIDVEVKRANAMVGVATTMVNSAKLELDFMKTTKKFAGSDFVPQSKQIETGGKK